MIKIVRGNDFKLSIPVEQKTGVDSDGKPILQPYDLSKVSNLKVVLKSQYSSHTLSFEVDSNVITCCVSGNLPNGVYNIEITGVDENGMSIRSYELSQFKIVESNQEADLYPTTEFEITSVWLNSMVFINFGGDSGPVDLSNYYTKEEVNKALENKVSVEIGKGLSSNDYTDEDKAKLSGLHNYDDSAIKIRLSNTEKEIEDLKNSPSSGIVISDSEKRIGTYNIAGQSYDLYQMSVELSGLPDTVGGTKDYVVSNEPLGNKLYLAVNSSVFVGDDTFYSDNFQVSKLFIDSSYNTNITIKCKEAVEDTTVKATITLCYIKMDFERVEFKLTNIGSDVDKSAIDLAFPNLKFDKKFAYTLIVDDDSVKSNKLFFTINKKWVDNEKFQHFDQEKTTGYMPEKTLGYTDGFGVEKRFSYGVAVWPAGGSQYIPNFMNPASYGKNYPYLVWSEVNKIKEFGNDIHFHDVNAEDVKNISDVLAGIEEAQMVTLVQTGNGMKVMVRPNGNDTYIEAAKQYPDIVFMTTEGGNYTIDSLVSGVDLRKGIIWRRNCDSIASEAYLAKIAENSAITDKWMCDFTHGPSEGMLSGIVTLNDTYGKDGDDSVWFAAIDEVFEYWFIRQFAKCRKEISGDDVIFTIFVPKVKYGSHLDFTAELTNVAYKANSITLLSNNIYGFNYGNKAGKFLLNVNLNKWLVDGAEKYTSKFEESRTEEDKEDALYFVNQLKEDLQAPFLGRINSGEVAPVLNAISINSGDTSTYDKEVNISLNVTGTITHYKVSESDDLSGIEWIESTAKNFSFILSDGFENKTVYVQVKNSFGVSEIKSATISYDERPAITHTVIGKSNNTAYGSVTPAYQTVADGGNATVSARANDGYIIESWLGADSSTGVGETTGKATVNNVTADKAITCNFKKEEVTPPSDKKKWIISPGWPYAEAIWDSETTIDKQMGSTSVRDMHMTDGSKLGKIQFNHNGTQFGANMTKNTDKRGAITGDDSGIYPDVFLANLVSPLVSKVEGELPKVTISITSFPNGNYKIKLLSNTINETATGDGTITYSIGDEIFEKDSSFPINNMTEYVVWENITVTDGTIAIVVTSVANNKINPINIIEIEEL